MSSVPTFTNNATAVTARNAEYAGDPLDDVDGDGNYNTYLGCNRAGSCAPGIGINTGGNPVDPKLSDWSIEDQHEAVRIPQDSQHIGGSGLGAGTEGLTTETPVLAIVDQHGTPDFNDTLSFIAALAQAAPGVGFGALNANPINLSDVTIEIGDRAWGANAVA